jgi:hypothetical protein
MHTVLMTSGDQSAIIGAKGIVNEVIALCHDTSILPNQVGTQI